MASVSLLVQSFLDRTAAPCNHLLNLHSVGNHVELRERLSLANRQAVQQSVLIRIGQEVQPVRDSRFWL